MFLASITSPLISSVNSEGSVGCASNLPSVTISHVCQCLPINNQEISGKNVKETKQKEGRRAREERLLLLERGEEGIGGKVEEEGT